RSTPRACPPIWSQATPPTTFATNASASSPAPSSRPPTASTQLRLCGDGRHHAGDAVPDQAGLLVALDLEGEAGDDLPPAAADLVAGDDLDLGAHPGAGRHRGRKANLVPAVVDAEREAGRGDHVLAEAVDERERQVAVGDRRPERALGLGSLDVDVDPLV